MIFVSIDDMQNHQLLNMTQGGNLNNNNMQKQVFQYEGQPLEPTDVNRRRLSESHKRQPPHPNEEFKRELDNPYHSNV